MATREFDIKKIYSTTLDSVNLKFSNLSDNIIEIKRKNMLSVSKNEINNIRIVEDVTLKGKKDLDPFITVRTIAIFKTTNEDKNYSLDGASEEFREKLFAPTHSMTREIVAKLTEASFGKPLIIK
ncbi:hypothetical protein [Ligilactobacillus salivarius]|uniref:hypothetical protein n=1 Tax=Ligilactobacillus salivarius TaxID=1624 RepID=UPI00136C0915|nr:hypothetical protein [Ligilactobacillus salivarius]MYY23203.1 hypothetical protein [Ligilactobacillus salivarius]MYY40086.1 hypothetical protein [Ligilactobacillus salivarius]